ncbi:hypothetical protein JXB12_07435 [candidate division KSB1 bacterium]|nr:hypothetical protein [candidate division KSB1 bacterium]
MNKSEQVFRILKENRLIALLAPKRIEQCVKAYEILNPLGIILEVALRTEVAMHSIEHLMTAHPEALILAGTVMTKRQCETALRCGVAGVVSADYIPDVVEMCAKNDVMCIPGGLSDVGKQLVQKADIYGCELEELRSNYLYQWTYKLFPAVTATGSNVGLSAAWRGPFKDLTVLYTGGVSLQNLNDVVQSDPQGIYCGSALTKMIEDPDSMRREAERWLGVLKGVE